MAANQSGSLGSVSGQWGKAGGGHSLPSMRLDHGGVRADVAHKLYWACWPGWLDRASILAGGKHCSVYSGKHLSANTQSPAVFGLQARI